MVRVLFLSWTRFEVDVAHSNGNLILSLFVSFIVSL